MGVYYVHHFGVYLHTGVGVIVYSYRKVYQSQDTENEQG